MILFDKGHSKWPLFYLDPILARDDSIVRMLPIALADKWSNPIIKQAIRISHVITRLIQQFPEHC